MALGFLTRSAQSAMSRRRRDLLARLFSSLSSPPSTASRIASSAPAPWPQQRHAVGIRFTTAPVRHLIGVAEQAEVPPDVRGAEYAPNNVRGQQWAPPDQRHHSEFYDERPRTPRGSPDRTPTEGGFNVSHWQQRATDSLLRGRNPPQPFPGTMDSPGAGNGSDGGLQGNAYGGSSPYLDQRIGGFPEQQTEEAADGNLRSGTIEELDGFLSEGKAKEAVQVLGSLENQGKAVDLDRLLKLMEVCGDAKAAEEARAVHRYLTNTIGRDNVAIRTNNRMLSVYCKCEAAEDARQLFDAMPERNMTSWETMMLGLADNGLGEDAIDLFNEFVEKGLIPDGHMFVALFRVCASLGAVDEGMLHFRSMSEVYGISLTEEHYAAVVRMHGDAGYLEEALDFIAGKMPAELPERCMAIVWESLLNCARMQGDVELGERCAEIVEMLEPGRLSGESKAGLLPVRAEDLARERRRKASSMLEVRSRVHEYRAGDTSHPEKDRIYALIKGIAGTLREGGYVPDTRFVLHDVEQESKEEALLAHSERLATAYGLISSSARSPIRIIKNLRICGDCHSYMKVLSKAVGRELIIRDAKRFHHFKDGVCSCRDYW